MVEKERTKPDEFSVLGLYGRREVFERRLEEGFTEVAFGGGPWVEGQPTRILVIFAFFHPDGRVATLERHKYEILSGEAFGGSREGEFETVEAFQEYITPYQVKIHGETRVELAGLLDSFSEFQ